jgi:hypothetical protein
MKRQRKKPNKDPVWDPSAQVYLTGIGPEMPSKSNPGSSYRQLDVSINSISNEQSGNSYIDLSMDNYESEGWHNISTILDLGHTLKGKGVVRKKYPSGDIYFDVDKIHDLELVDASRESVNNNFSTLFKQ